jgi:hypothetical protein
MTVTVGIRGIQEAQRWNQRAIAALKPGNEYTRAVRDIVTQLHRYEVSITHVDTGALRASLRMRVDGLKGRIYIDENSRNPRTGAKPSVYGEIENARGYSHAFGARTVAEAAPQVVGQALAYLGRSMT